MEFLENSSARVLTAEEVETLRPFFEERGATLPSPDIAFFVGCVEDGKIVAWQCVQGVCHVDPLYIEPGHQAKFSTLVHTAEAEIKRRIKEPCVAFLFAPPGRVEELAEAMGLRREPWVVMSKTIEPAGPGAPAIELLEPVSSESEDRPAEVSVEEDAA